MTQYMMTPIGGSTDLTTYLTVEAAAAAQKKFAPVSPTYLGQVATGCNSCLSNNSGNKQGMWRTHHHIRSNVDFLQVAYPNWYQDAAAGNNFQETATGGPMTVQAAIEYKGVSYPVTWSGAATGSVTAGVNSGLSDRCLVTMKKDDEFFIRTWVNNPIGGIIYSDTTVGLDVINGECATFGVTTPNLVASVGPFTNTGTLVRFSPCLIVSNTNTPSVFIIGDSRAVGVNDSYIGASGDIGTMARIVGPAFGYYKSAKAGDGAAKFIAGTHSARVAIGQYFSHIVNCMGFNDVNAYTRTPAETAADLTTMAGYWPNAFNYGITFSPNTSATTDAYVTTANQTVGPEAVDLSAMQVLIRAGISGYDGFFDIASVTESGIGTQKWIVNGVANFPTSDGKHETQALNLFVNQVIGNTVRSRIAS